MAGKPTHKASTTDRPASTGRMITATINLTHGVLLRLHYEKLVRGATFNETITAALDALERERQAVA